jgi:hypothetical protein
VAVPQMEGPNLSEHVKQVCSFPRFNVVVRVELPHFSGWRRSLQIPNSRVNHIYYHVLVSINKSNVIQELFYGFHMDRFFLRH